MEVPLLGATDDAEKKKPHQPHSSPPAWQQYNTKLSEFTAAILSPQCVLGAGLGVGDTGQWGDLPRRRWAGQMRCPATAGDTRHTPHWGTSTHQCGGS